MNFTFWSVGKYPIFAWSISSHSFLYISECFIYLFLITEMIEISEPWQWPFNDEWFRLQNLLDRDTVNLGVVNLRLTWATLGPR